MCEAHQTEGAEPKAERATATKIIFDLGCVVNIILKRQLILQKFCGRFSRYEWHIGTYHVYKTLKGKQKSNLFRLPYLTDKLRKYYPKGTKLYMTKEYTEDRYPHYHYLLGLEKDEWGCTPKQLTIRNTKLWTRKWKLGETFNYHDPDNEDNETIPFYVTSQKKRVDMGARQRWFKYGIHKYLLYMFKYSSFSKFDDYFIM